MWPWQNKKRKQKHIKAWIKNTNNDDFYTQIEFHSYMREQTKKETNMLTTQKTQTLNTPFYYNSGSEASTIFSCPVIFLFILSFHRN